MPALPKEMVEAVVMGGASARVEADVQPRFKAGDTIVVRNINPPTHTRMPRYIRGHRGEVLLDHGVFSFPNSSALGVEKPQHCYSVRFAAQELWGPDANPKDSLRIDLFDDYMDKV